MLAKIEEFHLTPAKPFHAGVVEQPFPAPVANDMHQAFEMGVVLTGEEERHFEGFTLSLSSGDMWLCSAWEPHGWRALAPGTQELVLQFLPEFLGEEVFDGTSWLTLFSTPPDQRPLVTGRRMREEVLLTAHEIRKEIRERRHGWLASVRLHILRLLLDVSRDWQPGPQAGASAPIRTRDLVKIMPAVRLVHSHPTRRLSLSEAASTCGLSVSQFGYLFRHLMGLSFGKFCTRARLAFVARALLSTNTPVEMIAQQAGFSDASHLHHAFVQVYGSTPARYRINGQRPLEGRPYREIEEIGVEDYPATGRENPPVSGVA